MAQSFPVHNSAIHCGALTDRVLPQYGLRPPIHCRVCNRGVNDTYRAKHKTGVRYLRVYRYGWRTKAQIEAELDMLTYLHRRRLPVSHPVKRKDGRYLTRIAAPEGTRYAAVFTEAPGEWKRLGLKGSERYGELAARMHACLDERPEDPRRFHLDRAHFIDEPLRYVTPMLAHRESDLDYLQKTGVDLWQRVDELLPERRKPEYGNCHGDHHGGNLHTDGSGLQTVFDFDCYGYGWRAYDMAVFHWSWRAWATEKAQKSLGTRMWKAFVRGYGGVRSLGQNELEATSVFVALRHIWLMGLRAQLNELSGGWLHDGYFDEHLAIIRRWLDEHRVLK